MSVFDALGVVGKKPDLAGKFSGTLLIVGGGRYVWDDVASFPHGGDVMAVNHVGIFWPGKLAHWYSNDVPILNACVAVRHGYLGMPFDVTVGHVHSCNEGAQYHWPMPGSGTSSLNAIYTGLALGYDSIVLAGVPLDDEGHFYDPPWVRSNFIAAGQDRAWVNARNKIFNGKVKSLSGRTKEWLGSP
jgi:hypothetical protein